MALDLTQLKRVGPQVGATHWTYKSAGDALTTCDGSGYFNGAADRLKVGDVIYVQPTSGACGFLKVDSNTRDLTATPPVSGVVDTLNALSLGTTDSD
ncbi:MAG: hypothetical protein LLG14_27205 [Nocardiaceae bacterium]|nr:hypothetical protein [Nocardiaceae bacterium]